MAKKQRLQFDLTPEAIEQLDQLKDLADASTRADVIRKALRLYSWFISERNSGSEFVVRKGDDESEVKILL